MSHNKESLPVEIKTLDNYEITDRVKQLINEERVGGNAKRQVQKRNKKLNQTTGHQLDLCEKVLCKVSLDVLFVVFW